MKKFTGLIFAVLALFSLQATGAFAQTYFDVNYMDVFNDRDVPEVCFEFTGELPKARDATLEDFVSVDPAIDVAVSTRGTQLCLSGFDFGGRYVVTLLTGLPGADGQLDGERVYDVLIQDRPGSIVFRGGNGYVLPTDMAKGLPLTTVNIAEAELRLVRINDRNLVQQFARGKMNQTFYDYDTYDLINLDGEIVWQGKIDITDTTRNKAVDSLVPIQTVLPKVEPGLYVALANNPSSDAYWEPVASQWFVISDLAISSFWGDDGITASIRKLSDAQPVTDAEVVLLAQNNAELAKGTLDANGLVHFDAGVTRGSGGNVPRAILVYGAAGDFNVLDVGGPSLDLYDRGVGGRSLPGPLDAFLYSERGIYRPGESVQVTALLRDASAKAVPGVPLTFKLWRPDGTEYEKYQASDAGGGAYNLTIDLPGSARTGSWELSAYADPDGAPIGRVSFEVEDFVPPQIEFDLAASEGMATPQTPVSVTVDAKYLYGAVAADLPGEATLILQTAEDPFPSLPGYRFGLEQESFTPTTSTPFGFYTDADGKALLEAWPDFVPETSQALEASLRVAVFDLSGRPVYRRITLPYDDKAFYIGVKPNFDGGYVAENTPAGFDVIATDRSGADAAAMDLKYEIFREEYDYVWYRSGGYWYAQWVSRDISVGSGDLSIAPGEPGHVEYTPDWGLYRVEVYDPAGKIATSVRFSGGWWSDPSADTPDEVEVSLDKESYQPGETAKVFIKPPFDSKVLVAVADTGVRSIQAVDVPAAGGFVEIPVTEEWTAGVYVLATAYQSGGRSAEMLPRRAVGVAWLGLDPAARALTVAFDAPEQIQPSQVIPVNLAIGGLADGEEAFVTLAAVDDGVLQLTGYEPPNPIDYYLGKRALGVSLNDLYGFLIDPTGDSIAGLREGGDLEGRNLESLPERSSKVVSLYSGIVKLDDSGRVTVPLDIPDFNGRLRLMAVAWSAAKIGSADQTMIVRAPVIADVTLPRFLAPGDKATSVLVLRNLDGASGDYSIELTGDGFVEVGGGSISAPGLATGAELRESVTLKATGIGVAHLTLTVSGPDGFSLVREKAISVRPASPTVSTREVAALKPGESVTVTPDVAANFYQGSASATLAVSSLPDFDVPGLLEALDRYPYGCAEQTVSRALPLLYVNDIAQALGQGDDAAISQRVQQAIYRLNNMQVYGGAYGLWGPWSNPDAWLSAYVMDFMTRAKEAGYHVPEAGYREGLSFLKAQTTRYLETPSDYASYAYAAYVLARAGEGDLSALRYFYETNWSLLPTPMARAQVSAALAWLGDLQRANDGFNAIVADASQVDYRPYDYGSDLRDLATAAALMAEGQGMDEQLLIQAVDRVSRLFNERQYYSTQEMNWLILATHGLVDHAGPMSLQVDGVDLPEQKTPLYSEVDFAAGEETLTVKNNGQGSLYRVLTVTGVPAEPLPPAEEGLTIRRRIFDLDGVPVDLKAMKQGENYLVLIEGRSHDAIERNVLVVDLLPAGWEIENANLGQGAPLEAYPWLGELSYTQSTEARDDRFAAAIDLSSYRMSFRTAYMVRAVTPGSFVMPGTYVEDMYRPEQMARGAASEAIIAPR